MNMHQCDKPAGGRDAPPPTAIAMYTIGYASGYVLTALPQLTGFSTGIAAVSLATWNHASKPPSGGAASAGTNMVRVAAGGQVLRERREH